MVLKQIQITHVDGESSHAPCDGVPVFPMYFRARKACQRNVSSKESIDSTGGSHGLRTYLRSDYSNFIPVVLSASVRGPLEASPGRTAQSMLICHTAISNM